MGVPVGESANDDTARLVLDIVQKVLEPVSVAVKDPVQRTVFRPRQNCSVNANINYMNASININYKRWSTCDGTEQRPINFPGNISTPTDPNCFIQEEITLRTSRYTRNHKMNFWDQYSGEHSVQHINNMNQRNLLPVQQQFINPNYLNSKFFGKNSWRDNPMMNQNVTNSCFNQQMLLQQQLKQEPAYYQYKKGSRKCCSFCRKNGESYAFYTSHSLYENGKPCCPVLRECVCNICGQNGHTMSHCNLNASKNSILKMIHRFNMMK